MAVRRLEVGVAKTRVPDSCGPDGRGEGERGWLWELRERERWGSEQSKQG